MVSSEKFDNATAFFPTSRPPPKWMLPQPSLPISQPVKSAKYNASGGVPGSQNTTDSDSSDDQSTSHTVSLREIIFTKFFVKMILRKKKYMPVHCLPQRPKSFFFKCTTFSIFRAMCNQRQIKPNSNPLLIWFIQNTTYWFGLKC